MEKKEPETVAENSVIHSAGRRFDPVWWLHAGRPTPCRMISLLAAWKDRHPPEVAANVSGTIAMQAAHLGDLKKRSLRLYGSDHVGVAQW